MARRSHFCNSNVFMAKLPTAMKAKGGIGQNQQDFFQGFDIHNGLPYNGMEL